MYIISSGKKKVTMKSKYTCPKCKRLMYTRQSRKCQFCGAELPEDLLLSEEEIEKNKKQRQRDHEGLDDYKKTLNDWSPYIGF
jgi:ribosomal protein L37AE/L43A